MDFTRTVYLTTFITTTIALLDDKPTCSMFRNVKKKSIFAFDGAQVDMSRIMFR